MNVQSLPQIKTDYFYSAQESRPGVARLSARNFGAVGDGITDDTIALQAAADFLAKRQSLGFSSKVKNFITLDLVDGSYLISQPLKFHQLRGCIIANGTVTASPDFPIDGYLFTFEGANTSKIENVLFECRKRASGIFASKFFRLRIEDCTILHQKSYGIHATKFGANHELEVFKCNITEYLWGDGQKQAKANAAIDELPDSKDAKNRESIGIFLGQADNVVADCNINFCKVGIQVGMRANRIQGNHITAGGTYNNEFFDGIVIDKDVKSSCLIVNNYIDNCRLKINISDKEICKRNYVTITDNLFYRGYNHPSGQEFNHIVVRALAENSILQNIIVSNNQFYTQDEHLDNQPERVIKPIHVDVSPYFSKTQKIYPSLDSNQIAGAIVSGNNFTNVHPYYEIPMATRLTGIIEMPDQAIDTYSFDFSENIPWGQIRSYSVTITTPTGVPPVAFSVTSVLDNKVTIQTAYPAIARFDITVDVNQHYSDSKYAVITH